MTEVIKNLKECRQVLQDSAEDNRTIFIEFGLKQIFVDFFITVENLTSFYDFNDDGYIEATAEFDTWLTTLCKIKCFVVTLFGQAVNDGASGVGQSHNFGAFVERLACSIINSGADNLHLERR